MDFLRAPRNLEFYVVGKLLMCSFSEFIAVSYFTYNC